MRRRGLRRTPYVTHAGIDDADPVIVGCGLTLPRPKSPVGLASLDARRDRATLPLSRAALPLAERGASSAKELPPECAEGIVIVQGRASVIAEECHEAEPAEAP
jgi:hypothetical protein